MLKKIIAAGAAASLALGLAACSSSTGSADNGETKDGVTVIKVGASPTPHAKILQYIDENLAADEGIDLEIVQFQDYIKPNEALAAGDIDANYFQTVPYLEEQQEKNSAYKFSAGEGIHLEPVGIYSNKIKNLDDLKDGDTIGIIDDPTNQGRGLELLAANDLIKLPKEGEQLTVSLVEKSKEYNPRGFKFAVSEGPKLVRSLDDVAIGAINGNYALSGGKTPADALKLESPEDNPSVNVLVWRSEDDDNAAIKKLEKLLHSEQVKKYIEKTWADKAVIPAF